MMLESSGIPFRVHEFDHERASNSTGTHPNYGVTAAEALGVEPERVFKTLVATVEGLATPGLAVGIVPVSGQLSLKALAAAVGGKRAVLSDRVVAQRVTGYVVGGISPFGQKRLLPTAIDESSQLFDTVFVSGGRRGLDIEISAADLISVLSAAVAPISTAPRSTS